MTQTKQRGNPKPKRKEAKDQIPVWRRWYTPGNVVFLFINHKITEHEYKLLMVIDGLTSFRGPQGKFIWCRATNRYLATYLKVHLMSVSVMINKLVRMELLHVKRVPRLRKGTKKSKQTFRYLKADWSEGPRRKWQNEFETPNDPGLDP